MNTTIDDISRIYSLTSPIKGTTFLNCSEVLDQFPDQAIFDKLTNDYTCMQTETNVMAPIDDEITGNSIIFKRCDNSTKEGSNCLSEEQIDDYIDGALF